jgi:hypothetical protein
MVDALDFRWPSREKVSHAGEITMKRHWETDELVEHRTLLPRETELLTNKTGATRLGFAVLLKFFQLEAYFPQQASAVPTVAVEFIAKQVKVAPEQFERYQWRGRTIEYHRAQIRKLHGFRETTVGVVRSYVRYEITASPLQRISFLDNLVHLLPNSHRQFCQALPQRILGHRATPIISGIDPTLGGRSSDCQYIPWELSPFLGRQLLLSRSLRFCRVARYGACI